MTPVEIVIQKGPNDDLLYLCRMSAHARYKGSLIFLNDAYKSANPTPVAKLELLTFFMLKKLSLRVAYFTGDKDNILLVTNESRSGSRECKSFGDTIIVKINGLD